MNTRALVFALSLFAAASLAAPAFADDEEALKKDLTSVIALHGLPCGQVIAATVQADSDFAASCKDGNKYRVYMNATGRVLVEKQP
jgi:hypothetical protein